MLQEGTKTHLNPVLLKNQKKMVHFLSVITKINYLYRYKIPESGNMKFLDYQKIVKLAGNKFFIASLLFVVWILFLDKNNLVDHIRNMNKLENLEKQKEFYREKIRIDKQKLEYLNSGTANLEKFAREQYYMVKPGEEVYIVVEK